MLTQCEAAGASSLRPYGMDTLVLAAMNSSQSKDDWVKTQQHKLHKPIDVDTLMWVRNRLMRLEVEARWADRICVFEEFFPNDAIIPRI
jgi:hypothetical protein